MKSFASMFWFPVSLVVLAGCNPLLDSDNIDGPENGGDYDNPPPEPGPPQLSIRTFDLSSAVLTQYQNYLSLTLTVQNGPGTSTAYNVHAVISAIAGGSPVAQTGLTLPDLTEGQSSTLYIDLESPDRPSEVDVSITWNDAYGYSYSVGGVARTFGAFSKK